MQCRTNSEANVPTRKLAPPPPPRGPFDGLPKTPNFHMAVTALMDTIITKNWSPSSATPMPHENLCLELVRGSPAGLTSPIETRATGWIPTVWCRGAQKTQQPPHLSSLACRTRRLFHHRLILDAQLVSQCSRRAPGNTRSVSQGGQRRSGPPCDLA